MPAILSIALGAVLLLAGYELFWVFVGVAGFVAGLKIAQMLFAETTPLMDFLVAGGCGLAGIIAAAFFQGVAIAVAGFITGVYLTFTLLSSINAGIGLWQSLIIIFGGILGAGVGVAYFDWALISLSVLAGAVLIVEAIPVNFFLKAVIFCALVIVGLFAQAAEKHAHTPAVTGNRTTRIKEK